MNEYWDKTPNGEFSPLPNMRFNYNIINNDIKESDNFPFKTTGVDTPLPMFVEEEFTKNIKNTWEQPGEVCSCCGTKLCYFNTNWKHPTICNTCNDMLESLIYDRETEEFRRHIWAVQEMIDVHDHPVLQVLKD